MEKKKILFVDDEEDFLKIMKIAIEESGEYEVVLQSKGAKAVDLAMEIKPDLILLDIVMPDMDGYEILCRIKTVDCLKNIPIIFLSAFVRENEAFSKEGGLMKGYPFLAKPISIERLISCIRKNIK